MKTELPAGEYYIGDPCYVIADLNDDGVNEWYRFLEASGMHTDTNISDGTEFEYKGHMVWMNHTAYGDGEYFDQDKNRYDVDAGLIGVVPVEVTNKEQLVDTIRGEYGQIKTFNENFTVECYGGVFFIGPTEDGVMINTEDPNEGDWTDNMYKDLEY